MKNKMKLVPLSSICKLKQWKTIPTSKLMREGYPVYGANGIIGFYNQFNHQDRTIMICCRGATCGSINISQGKCYINGNAMCLDNLSEEFDIDFVAFFLKHMEWNKIITGTAQPQITQIGLQSVYLPKLELHKQQNIAKYLLKLQQSIKIKEEQLKDLDELIQARFTQMFENTSKNISKKPLSKVCPIQAFNGEVESIDGKYWLLNLDVIESNTGYVLEETYTSKIGSSTIKFSRDNILYSKLRPYLNKVVIPNKSGYATSELVPFAPTKEINKYYFAYFLRRKSFVDYINANSNGTRMPRASMDILKNFLIPVPPLPLQNQFAGFVQKIEKAKEIIKTQIKDLQELLDLKMDKYFK